MEKELVSRGALLKVCTPESENVKSDITMVDQQKRLVTASFADGGEFVATSLEVLLNESCR
jgi:hypothetical protein